MTKLNFVAALLGSTALFIATPALAQEPLPEAQQQPEPENPDTSDATADQAIAATAPVDDAQAKIELLQAQVEALQEALEAVKKQVGATTPSWKGAPQLADKEGGWSFKPRGRLMYDFGYVGHPRGYDNKGLGFGNEVRRARLGVEGTLPGDFGYKFELDFAGGEVEFTDAYLSYSTGPWELAVGQQKTFQSLEELTSSLNSSFIERAAFTDAFNLERRVGFSAQYSKGPLLAQGGLFTDNISDLNSVGDDNNSYSFNGRLVYMPVIRGNQLHFGASIDRRDLNDAATSVRYRQRPVVHFTDVRFIDTGSIGEAKAETGYGFEAAGIFGPFYVASEAFWQKVSREGLSDPTFFGAYVDAGYFFTGETRGYKGGKFDRVKVKHPFDKGGWGSFGANVRWDYLNLVDTGIVGGKQNAFQLSLNWKPMDYVLFGFNVAHIVYRDAAIAVDGDRDYSVNVAGLRSQVDF